MTAQPPPGSPTAPPPYTGPAGAGGPPPKPPKRKKGVGFAIFVAFLAVLVAVLSGGVALWSLKKANDATTSAQQALDRIGQAQPVAPAAAPTEPPAPTGAPRTAEPEPGASLTGEPTLNPQANYEGKYTNQDLKAPTSSYSYIDLDAPRVGDQDAADVIITGSGFGAANIGFENVRAALADDPAVTPFDCAKNIDFSPLDTQSRQSFRKGTTFCVLTSAAAAAQRGDNQQMVVVTVKDVDADVVVLTANAWKVPR